VQQAAIPSTLIHPGIAVFTKSMLTTHKILTRSSAYARKARAK